MAGTRNIRIPQLSALLLCCSVVLLTQHASPAAAQDGVAAASGEDWRSGYRGFRMLLEEQGVQAEDDAEQVLRFPRQSVILVLGRLMDFPARDWLRLRRFVAQGGALLVAGEDSFRLPGVTRFVAGPVESIDAREFYLQHSDVLALRCEPGTPLTVDVSTIVVNRTAWMTVSEDESLNWTTIARLSKAAIPSAAAGQPVVMLGMDPQDNAGVMILCADGSLFADGMLWHGENSILAINAAELLCRGNRRRMAVLEYGGIPQSGLDQPNPFNQQPPNSLPRSRPQIRREQLQVPPAQRDLKNTIATMNALLDKVQKTNLLNETLRDRPRSMPPAAWLRTILLLIGICLGVWLLLKLLRSRRRTPPAWQAREMQSLFTVTSARQIAGSEFGASAEILCREFCLQVTGSDYELDWLKLRSDSHKAPLIENLARAQRTALNDIVSIATNGAPPQLTRKRFEQLGAAMRQLWQQHRQRPLLPASAMAVTAD